MMDKICARQRNRLTIGVSSFGMISVRHRPFPKQSVTPAAVRLDLKAKAIVTVTTSGRTARLISRFRPECLIIATSDNERVIRQLQMSWGVKAYFVKSMDSTEEMFDLAKQRLRSRVLSVTAMLLLLPAVRPLVCPEQRTLKVDTIGSILCRGKSWDSQVVHDRCYRTKPRGSKNVVAPEDSIIVAGRLGPNAPPHPQSKAVVLENPDERGYGVLIGEALEIPVMYDCQHATQILKSGSSVIVDCERGIIS